MLANAPILAMIPCVDITVARAFYGGTLGLSALEIPTVDEAPMTIYLCGNGSQLLVYQRETPTKADHTAAGWIVEDVDETADYLISRGVTLKTYPDMEGVDWDDRGVGSMGELKSAWFTDPEGNILSVASMP